MYHHYNQLEKDMQKLLIIMMLGLLAISCGDDTIVMQKSQGQCGETWGDTFLEYEEGNAIEVASSFLDSIGISSTGLRLDSLDQGVICVTCHDCPNGRYYILEADADDEQTLLDLQFTKQ